MGLFLFEINKQSEGFVATGCASIQSMAARWSFKTELGIFSSRSSRQMIRGRANSMKRSHSLFESSLKGTTASL